ncbi:MAG: hypothetical protein H6667_25580 [Ardenticatenaceae bacterium]|nr:hypothetical protein [Ardenticatenaceae bacterium]
MRGKNNRKNSWIDKFDLLILAATAVFSGVISLLDFLGMLDEIPWLAERVPILILLAIALIAGYLALERNTHLESIQSDIEKLSQEVTGSTSTIINSLEGVEFQEFDGGNALLSYVSKRLLQARKQVDDLSWGPGADLGVGLEVTQQAIQGYWSRIDRVSRKILYREVFVFNSPERLRKLREMLKEDAPGYSCAFYKESYAPLIQFMLIDQEEVIILNDQFPSYLAIRHSGLAKLFTDYYEAIWAGATKIKEGPIVHQEIVNQILNSSDQETFTK